MEVYYQLMGMLFEKLEYVHLKISIWIRGMLDQTSSELTGVGEFQYVAALLRNSVPQNSLDSYKYAVDPLCELFCAILADFPVTPLRL